VYRHLAIHISQMKNIQAISLTKFGFIQIFHFKYRQKMTSLIDVMFVTNDINIINIDRHNANIHCSFLDENTQIIIIVYASLILKGILNQLYHIRLDCFKSYHDFCNLTQKHVAICLRIWYTYSIRNIHVYLRIQWPVQICGHYVYQLHR
jgi:hypothetical protein